ncbi:hypothetical protein V6N13_025559 [Hibiscus sabdariffa]
MFYEVQLWFENASYGERATWIELFGLQLHSWNHETIRKVAELWGIFEALGENANLTKDCEMVSALISTSYERKIEEIVEIEVGNVIHSVRVVEVGFKDEFLNKVSVQKNEMSTSVDCSNSSVESSSDHDRSKSPEPSSVSSSQSGKPKRLSNVNSSVMDSINANLLENGPNGLGNINAAFNNNSERVNNKENENPYDSDEENNMSKKDIPTPQSREKPNCKSGPSWAEVVGNGLKETTNMEAQFSGLDKVREDVENMGFGRLEIQLEEGVAVKELVKDSGSSKSNSAMGIRGFDGENKMFSPKKNLRSYLACGKNPSGEESNPDNVGGKFDLPEFHSSIEAPRRKMYVWEELGELKMLGLTHGSWVVISLVRGGIKRVGAKGIE